MNRCWASLAAWCLIAPCYATHTGGLPDSELLEPDKAFALSTRVVDAHTLEAHWDIADGYYMYKDKFKFQALEDAISLGTPVFPAGKKKQDPFFGTLETYSEQVTVRLPITRRQQGPQQASLRITAQGCNEPVGVCYPPIIKQPSFALPAVAEGSTNVPKGALAGTQALRNFVGTPNAQQEFLPPDQAFVLAVEHSSGKQLRARFTIADGYYLYRDKVHFAVAPTSDEPANNIRLGAYELPAGRPKVDEYFGETTVYYHGVEVALPLVGRTSEATAVQLTANYQGCAENGICYEPIAKRFDVRMGPAGILAVTPSETVPQAASPVSPVNEASTPGEGETRPSTSTWLWVILGAFGTGLLLTFTPCVLPMIPILSSIVVGQGTDATRLRSGLLAITYVLGTAVTYTVIGAVAGATGDQLQAYFQNVWAIGLLAAVLGAMALSMFGLYQLQVPGFMQSRLQRRLQGMRGGSLVGVFALGAVSALIVGACVSPLLISVLSVAIASQDAVLGGVIMFSMAWGMGTVLVAVAVGASFLLPKAGPWMERIKHVFGVLLLAIAIYLLGLIPQVPVLLLWGALFIVVSVYLGATDTLPGGSSGWRYLWKGLGTFLLVWGVLALIGGLTGNRDVLRPLPLSLSSTNVQPLTLNTESADVPGRLFERISSLAVLEQRLSAARAAARPVLIDYYAEWCTDCLRMERTTFSDPAVRRALSERFVLLQLDVTDAFSPETRALKQRFGVYGPPATLFLSADGQEQRELRFYGFRSTGELLQLLGKVNTAEIRAQPRDPQLERGATPMAKQ
jgi:thiol:disulfide interchange protein DsbD